MSEHDHVQRGWEITGRVQGVGFRWWTRRAGEELGLAGTVRNRADGAVEVHARGPETEVESLRRRLERGPSAAQVEGVRALPSDGALADGFHILR